eukprot:CAMPEP_0206181818 /NCGR_PEP_ID=MMETSP1474-20131121/69023_1 /ASSEMBLY_ACC=CAM_ASM_001110 /TAXON_ID=97495 /ORGANISM="Imantonia sp., Strain RCC918" /LENGTH=387 /DNA_ID=CAMNT_0053596131 /DNA_START=12 /DNA_END=1175 /DNA_ORIENTATION=+
MVQFINGVPPGNETYYLVEAIDTTRDVDGGHLFSFPPMHNHHSSSNYVGLRDPRGVDGLQCRLPSGMTVGNMEAAVQCKGSFGPYNSVISDAYFAPNASWNFPMAVPDLICQGMGGPSSDGPSRCGYLKLPVDTAVEVLPTTDIWAEGWYQNVLPAGGRSLHVHIEFGRKWIRRTADTEREPGVMLQFTSTADRDLVTVPSRLGESIAWQTYIMPKGGTIRRSLAHLHANLPTEMWIVDVGERDALPARLLQHWAEQYAVPQCDSAQRATCTLDDNSWGATKAAVGLAPLGLGLAPLGLSFRSVQDSLLARHPSSLRCRYRTQLERIGDREYTRASRRSRPSRLTCDDWRFEMGQSITLIAFMSNNTLNHPFTNHHHWDAYVNFDMD